MTSVTLSSQFVKAEAVRLGFNACGLCRATRVESSHLRRLSEFVERGEQGEMDYLARNTEVRANPSRLVERAQTIVSVALSYYPSQHMPSHAPRLSFYAYGKDYHVVVRNRLQTLLESLREAYIRDGGAADDFEGRAFCDTAPLPERYWAWKAGLGWIGRNTQLILPQLGSYFFLGELIVSVPADAYDSPIPSDCGDCRRCLDACPMHALTDSGHIDARRCLSYLTIEQRGPLSPEARRAMGSTLYGCDRCQLCCPHNFHPVPTTVDEFMPSEELLKMKESDWLNLTHEEWCRLFRGSAVKRAKYEGFMRNVNAVLGKKEESEE